MTRRTFLSLFVVLAGFGLAVSSLAANAQNANNRGRKYKAPPPTARIEVTILRASNEKPIENAAVVFHPMEGEKDKGNMELKTDPDGKAVIDVLPIGDIIRVQVIAKGFQTFGQDYKVDKPQLAIEIRMKRPGEQYSIYKPHDQAKDAPPAQPKDKKDDGSGKPEDAQSTPAQPQQRPN
jgi:hypothetical protein